MPHPKVKISDNSGNTVDISDNKLLVNAAISTAISIAPADTIGGTAYIDDADWVDGESRHLLVGGLYQSTPQTVTDGDVAPLSISSTGELNVEMVTGSLWQTYAAANDTDLGNIDTNTSTIAGDTTEIAAYFKQPSNAYGSARGLISLGFRQDTLGSSFSGLGIANDDWTYLQVNSKGALYVTGGEVENAAVQSEPMLMGGRYDSSARTLGNGDAGAIALNDSGHALIDVVDGGQLDTIIDTLETTLTAIETDQAAIEVLLAGIDADTDAIKTSVQILDDWDDSNYANVNINLAGSDAPTGGGAESGALRVTIANDSSGVLSVDDGGGALTVDNGGTFAVQVDGDALTALQLIDDVVYVDDANWTGESSKHMLVGGVYASSGLSVTDGDVSPLLLGVQGSLIIDVLNGGVLEGHVDGIETTLSSMLTAVQLIDDTIGTDGSTGPLKCISVGGTDSAGNIQELVSTTGGILKVTHGMTGMVHGVNTDIDTAAEQLDGSTSGLDTACKRVDLQASILNAGIIYVGGSDTIGPLTGGIELEAGDFYSIDIDNLNDIWVEASVADQVLRYVYFT